MGLWFALWLLAGPTWQLEHSGDEHCPELDEVQARVDEYLTESTLDAQSFRVHLLTEGLRAELAIHDGALERRHVLEAASCEELIGAASLLIAVSIDPLVLDAWDPRARVRRRQEAPFDSPNESSGPREQATVPSPPPTTSTTEAPSAAPPVSDSGSPPVVTTSPPLSRSGLGLRSSLGSGVTPALNFGVGLDYAYRFAPRWSFRLGAHYSFRRVARVAGGTGGIGMQAPVGTIRVCTWGLPGERLELGGCVGGNGGALIGRSVGVDSPMTRTVAWGTALVAATLRWPREAPVALAIDLEGWAAFDRVYLKFDGVTGTYRPDAVGIRGLLGVDLRFFSKATQ